MLLLRLYFSFSQYDLTCRDTEGGIPGRLTSAVRGLRPFSRSSPGEPPGRTPGRGRERRPGAARPRAPRRCGDPAAPRGTGAGLPLPSRPVPPGQRPRRGGRRGGRRPSRPRTGPQRRGLSQRPPIPPRRAAERDGAHGGAGLSGGGRWENYPFALFRGLPDRQHLPRPGTPAARVCPDVLGAKLKLTSQRSGRTLI